MSILKFGEALIKHALAGYPKVSDEIYTKRLQICNDCDKIDRSFILPKCSICGCILEQKTRWADQGCPDYPPKWEPEVIQLNTNKAKEWTKPNNCGC